MGVAVFTEMELTRARDRSHLLRSKGVPIGTDEPFGVEKITDVVGCEGPYYKYTWGKDFGGNKEDGSR